MAYEVEATSELTLPDGRPMGVMNTTSISTGEIARHPEVQRLGRELSSWVEHARSGSGRGGMFDRTTFTPPNTPYDNMRTAMHALLEDDIVSGVADATEAMAFEGGLKWESEDSDEADVFNQMAADLNLDAKIREMWREDFAVDQYIGAKLWGWKTYTVRGRSKNGNRRKKTYRVWAPTRLVTLDSMRVVPIGHGPLREDRLAWQSTEFEIGSYQSAFKDETIDPLMVAFFQGTWTPTGDERAELIKWGVHVDKLLAMNPAWVFRHCSTRPDYKKFADLRMRSVFPLLDLKRQLMASDRAMLVGSANYILLIRKGTDQKPGTADEIQNLKGQYNFLAKLPVIISDHRLDIEIIAPKLDFVLKKDSYDVLDRRILTRVLSAFVAPGSTGAATGSSDTFENALAKSIQNRRHMIKRTLEKELARAIVEHPRNAGTFNSRPSLVFTPRNVSVGMNQGYLAMLATLRTQRELSRDTILEFMGLDQATEAQRLELEDEIYDEIFKTQIPFASPDAVATPGDTKDAPDGDEQTPNGTAEAPAVSGRRGGRPVGGGTRKQSPAAMAKPKTNTGNPSTKKDA